MFTHLRRGLEKVGAHPETLRLVRAAIDEEDHHRTLCKGLVEYFGGTPSPVLPRPLPTTEPTRESVLIEVVGMCCINETVSAAALGEMQRNTRGTPVHAVVTAILRDEVQHARIGWSHLAFESQRGEVAGLACRLQELVDAAVGGLDEEPDHAVTPELLRAGALDRASRVRVLRETLEEVVLPGLRAHGVCPEELRLPFVRSETGVTPREGAHGCRELQSAREAKGNTLASSKGNPLTT